MRQVTLGVGQIGGQRQAPGQRGFGIQAGEQAVYRLRRAGSVDGRLQMHPPDLAGLPLLAEPGARHQHRAAPQPGQ